MLKEAKRLQRAAKSRSKLQALPVLRRLIASQIFREISLAKLMHSQDRIQRKHLLQLLSVEAGQANWAEYRRFLGHNPNAELKHELFTLRATGYPNHWFSSLAEAQNFTVKYGGHAYAYGTQALVIPAEQPDSIVDTGND